MTILLLPGVGSKDINTLRLCPSDYGWLLTPQRTRTQAGLLGLNYGIDNECFTLGDGFEPLRYLRVLERIKAAHGIESCLFATAPDVVANAKATLERFGVWSILIREVGFPVALVAQDGLEDLEIPWQKLDAIFIGGSTDWKMGDVAAEILLEAQSRGVHTHVGRVNSFYRVDKLKVKPDSIDGTFMKRFKKYGPAWQSELDSRKYQGRLLEAPRWGE